MKRLAVAVLLALFAHGLLLLTGDFQMKQRAGRDADEPKRISVSLEHYTPHEQGQTEEVSDHEFELPEEPDESEDPEESETEKKPPQEPVEEELPRQPEPEKKQPEEETRVKQAQALQEAEAAHEAESGPEQEEKTREADVQKPEDRTSALNASPVPQEPAGAPRMISQAALEAHEALDEYISEAGREDEELQMARPLYRENTPPEYPRRARQRNQQGKVILEVLVNSRGRVEEMEVAESSGYSILDRAAKDAVRDWVFEPGRRGEQSVDTRVRVPVRFELQ
ncbi:TonB family protein [Desulfonatronospira thiodismutans ASO3-1]|uniref:TonB family protein n=1 Tax=Desulfonatronospira thiodismutans ASO3-1 TaxID=555779 RepID=D6SL70_9BACT|nr:MULTISPECIES: energy transducer TonB [Desulfonatronospira]EFI35431.1 TonB family protein [Desulfonatronospira thiodismutans ASO3-1]RQD78035.1 MAG: energy transducer TonB [Desulfonatronospira sp. MSAO_Bac3]